MLDEKDLQAIAQLIRQEVQPMIDESEARMKAYIDERAKTATSHAIAYAEGALIPKFELLADAHALTQQQIAAVKSDIDRIDFQLGQHEGKFYLLNQKAE